MLDCTEQVHEEGQHAGNLDVVQTLGWEIWCSDQFDTEAKREAFSILGDKPQFSTFSCVPWAGSFEAQELGSALFLKEALACIQHCEE